MPTTELPEPLWAVLSALSDLPVARLQEQLKLQQKLQHSIEEHGKFLNSLISEHDFQDQEDQDQKNTEG